jgi:hypothetical protein
MGVEWNLMRRHNLVLLRTSACILVFSVGCLCIVPQVILASASSAHAMALKKKRPPTAAEREKIQKAIDQLRLNGETTKADQLQEMLDTGKILMETSLGDNEIAQALGDGIIYLNPDKLTGNGNSTEKWLEREMLASSLFHELVHILQYKSQAVWRRYSDYTLRLRMKEIAAYQAEIAYLTQLADSLTGRHRQMILREIARLQAILKAYEEGKLP